ncbi:MAG: RHS repeat-associated core domain-containing protein, partial [Methylacidiphilales bacterium]|nr:RHS repeat-associated core domain-containing protein [Candidatus Methylacidiphilales bacterium]
MQSDCVQSVSENRAQKVAVASLLLNPSSSFIIDTTRNRIYSTVHGRFMQPDPIGFEARDVNWYRYVNNSPLNYTDPEGLFHCEIDCAFADLSNKCDAVIKSLVYA